ncbi:hypothetical protein HYH03_012259 [Edaphochlamys debaryana]|uniref:Ion transport domain-containing protein n=1 Tax=Edaphochlamys debaryana TaxID=47281 RepID=A0A836BVP2_9CHLO|nr:hypothetical protein HYH03_012259 [Edaphochlamys debaryana]|eukprot:KAG2489238.1 hypothetical protein HYH03_012259 [Edaphochlamys debaryana]
MGFFMAPGCYLRDGWNVVDFVVVVLGFVDIFSSGNLTALRTVRVLRPLRAVTRISGMRVLVMTMLDSIPMLLDVFLLCAFTFFIFGLIAVQLFSGVLRYRCGTPVFDWAYTLPGTDGVPVYGNVTYTVTDDDSGTACSGPMEAEWYNISGSPVASLGPGGHGYACPNGGVCVLYGNPNYGMTSFDHILWAWLTIFQCITQESWTDIMYYTQDALTWWVWPFYVVLVVFGSFYLVNLALAVLFVQFSAEAHEEDKAAAAEGKKGRRKRKGKGGEGAEGEGVEAGEGGDGTRAEKADAAGAGAAGGGGAGEGSGSDSDTDSDTDSDSSEGSSVRRLGQATGLRPIGQGGPSLERSQTRLPEREVEAMAPWRRRVYDLAVSRALEVTTMSLIVVNTLVMCVNWFGMPSSVERATNIINYVLTCYFLVELVIKLTGFGFRKYFKDGMNVFDFLVVVISITEMLLDIIPSVAGVGPLSVLRAFRLLRVFRLARNWKELNMIIRAIFKSVGSTTWLLLLMLLFMFIAALMGMQLFGYKFMFCDYVAGAAAVCPLGLRIWGDCPNHFHCYLPCDAGTVGSWVDAPGSFYNDLAYCERFCGSPEAAAAADANATAAAVASAGGCEYLAMVGKSQVPRANFDNIFWGLYTVFQLLTQENWNNVMYDGMRSTTPWAGVYFVVTMLAGTYLVFNLFIAILLDNFSGTFADGTKRPEADVEAELEAKKGSDSDSDETDEDEALFSMRTTDMSAWSGGDEDDEDYEEVLDDDEDDEDHDQGVDHGDLGDGYEHPLRVASRATSEAAPDPNAPPPSQQQPQAQARGQKQQDEGGGGPRSSVDLPSSPSDNHRHRGSMGRRIVPVDSNGRPVSPARNAASPTQGGKARPVSAFRGPGNSIRPVSSKPGARPISAYNRQGQGPNSIRPISAKPGARPVSAFQRQGNGNSVRPISAKPGARPVSSKPRAGGRPDQELTTAPSTVKFAADPAPHRQSPSGDGVEADGDEQGEQTRPPEGALTRTTSLAASAFQSMVSVKHNDHLAKCIRGRALLLFGPDNWLRWRAARLVHHTYFEHVSMLLILASSITLALDTPQLRRDAPLAIAIKYMDYVFTGAFTVEALLKIITFGFLFTGKHAYLRSGWNILDFIVVLVGYALIAIDVAGVDGENLKMLRVLRTLRALRPLRAASRYEGLKVVVNSLFAVLPAMANVALVCLLFYIIFAILAVNLFKGQLFNCINADSGVRLDPYYLLPPGATLDRSWCVAGTNNITGSDYYDSRNISMPPYTINTLWVNPTANFDNVGIAILSLFQVATLELWVDIMFSAVDTAGVDKQPLWNHRPYFVLFFVVFVLVCSFFVLNLFIGITLDKFAELQQAQMRSSVFVTQQQQTWIDIQKLLLRTSLVLSPVRPDESLWREQLYDFVQGQGFENAILATICVNVLFMGMVHSDMSPQWQDCMSYTNLIFTCVFVVEAVLKLLAFGPRSYFRDKWHAFDFFVMLISVLSVALDFSNTRNLTFMPVLRVLRIVRVFRLIKKAQGLKRLLLTLVQSLPALANVGSVMLLFFFIYAIVGMNLFGGIKQGDYITRHNNFDNFPNSMLALMRMITGESWSGMMQECMVTHGCVRVMADTTSPANGTALPAGTYLDPHDPLLDGVDAALVDNECALSPAAAVIFFPTFVILCGFILLNLIIAVILENMIMSETDENLPVPKTLVGQFVEAWSQVDHDATGFIHASRLPYVISSTPEPLGTRGPGNTRAATQAVIMSVDIPIHANNTVTFIEVLHALAGRVAGTELPDIEEDWLVERFCRRLPGGGEAFPRYTAAHFHAALYVQAAVRGFMARHRMRDMMSTFADTTAAAASKGGKEA